VIDGNKTMTKTDLEFKELDKAKQAREDLSAAFNKYEDLLKLTK